ncbi:MAG: APC family permease [Peptococcaceae bacterium]|nr:MAG: APC family permease [Peptococcaceae bacterium]
MQLKRVLTLRTVVATSAGLTLASSCFLAAVQVAGYVLGDSAWIAILIGGALCLLSAACFSELNGMLPSAAGIRLYFSRAFNEQISLVVSIFYMLIVVIGVIGAESYILSRILNESFPAIPSYVWIVLLLAAVTGMNIRGVKIAGAFQDVITYGLVISLVTMSLIALYKVNFRLTTPLHPGGMEGIINAVAIGIFLYVGFEWVTPLAEEVTKVPLVSRGMFLAMGVLSVVYAVFTVAMTASVPKEMLTNSAIPQMIFARTVLGDAGAAWMVVFSLAATITTFNAGLMNVSRFMYAGAREHVLPVFLSRISPRFFTPWVAILVLLGIALAVSASVLLTHRYLLLVEMAAAVESIVYALTGLAVISLRRRMTDCERPFRIKGGLLVPLLTFFIFSMLAVAVMAENSLVFAGLLTGVLICWAYVKTVVPYLKEKHRSRRSANRRRPARLKEQ